MKCDHCGREFEGAFCPNCGTAAASAEVCPACGEPCAAGDSFCSKCGAALGAALGGAPESAAPAESAESKTERETRRLAEEARERRIRAEVAREVTAMPEGYRMPKPMREGTSDFTGGAAANFFIRLALVFGTIFSLGLAYPALKCWQMRWEVSRTYMNGRRLVFDGKAYMLYGSYIKWLLLSIVTIGIYAIFVLPLNLKRWQTAHTHVLGVRGQRSKFTGSVFGRWACNFVNNLLCILTLFLGWFWTKCRKRRWYAEHTIIDGCSVEFDGHAAQYFGKCIVWLLLTVVTIGIYSVWLLVKTKKWTAYHTKFRRADILPAPADQALLALREDETERRLKAERKAEGAGARSLAAAFSITGLLLFFVGVIASICMVDYANVADAINRFAQIKTSYSLISDVLEESAYAMTLRIMSEDAAWTSLLDSMLTAGIICFIGFALAFAGAILNKNEKAKTLRRTGGWAMALNGLVLCFLPLFFIAINLPLPAYAMNGGASYQIEVRAMILSVPGAIGIPWLAASIVRLRGRKRAGKRVGGTITGVVFATLFTAACIVLLILFSLTDLQ